MNHRKKIFIKNCDAGRIPAIPFDYLAKEANSAGAVQSWNLFLPPAAHDRERQFACGRTT